MSRSRILTCVALVSAVCSLPVIGRAQVVVERQVPAVPTVDASAVPQLSTVYSQPNGDAVLIEQRGTRLRLVYRSRAGEVIGHADLNWSSGVDAFEGRGLTKAPCIGGATRSTAEAPITIEQLFVPSGSTLRVRWLNPDRVDCVHGRTMLFSWQETLWYRDDEHASKPAASAAPGKADYFTVYLSGPMRDGFVDTSRALQDSVSDIRRRLVDAREFKLVDKREGADIVLTIVARGVGSEEYGHRLSYTEYYKNAVLTSTPMVANTWWVATVMEVGPYHKEFAGAWMNHAGHSMGAWSECASQIVGDLRSWVVANTPQLLDRSKLP